MRGHPHWRGQATARPGRSGFRPARAARRSRPPSQSRRGLVAFAAALSVALGTVVMMIATISVQAMAEGAMAEGAIFNDPKADSWVGMAAVGSVLVCALLGMVIVHRYTSTRDR